MIRIEKFGYAIWKFSFETRVSMSVRSREDVINGCTSIGEYLHTTYDFYFKYTSWMVVLSERFIISFLGGHVLYL